MIHFILFLFLLQSVKSNEEIKQWCEKINSNNFYTLTCHKEKQLFCEQKHFVIEKKENKLILSFDEIVAPNAFRFNCSVDFSFDQVLFESPENELFPLNQKEEIEEKQETKEIEFNATENNGSVVKGYAWGQKYCGVPYCCSCKMGTIYEI